MSLSRGTSRGLFTIGKITDFQTELHLLQEVNRHEYLQKKITGGFAFTGIIHFYLNLKTLNYGNKTLFRMRGAYSWKKR